MPKLDSDIRQRRSGKTHVLDADELARLQDAARGNARTGLLLSAFGVLVAVCALVSFCIGRYAVSIPDVLASFGALFEHIASSQSLEFSDPVTSVVINVLSFGDEEAAALGVDTRRLRLAVIVCATLVTGSAVSVAGQVGWIGLVVPHLARMVVGPNYKHLLPMALVMGAGFLLVVDDVARTIMTSEIPLGILTAIIGAPVFVFLLVKGRRGWV